MARAKKKRPDKYDKFREEFFRRSGIHLTKLETKQLCAAYETGANMEQQIKHVLNKRKKQC